MQSSRDRLSCRSEIQPLIPCQGTHLKLTASNSHQFGAYRVDPAGTPKGGIVVIQEIFGVNRHIRSVADRYAALGPRIDS